MVNINLWFFTPSSEQLKCRASSKQSCDIKGSHVVIICQYKLRIGLTAPPSCHSWQLHIDQRKTDNYTILIWLCWWHSFETLYTRWSNFLGRPHPNRLLNGLYGILSYMKIILCHRRYECYILFHSIKLNMKNWT